MTLVRWLIWPCFSLPVGNVLMRFNWWTLQCSLMLSGKHSFSSAMGACWMPRPWEAEGKSWSFFQSQRLLLPGRSWAQFESQIFIPLTILSFLLQRVKGLYQTLQQLRQDWLTAFQDFGFIGELRNCISVVLSFYTLLLGILEGRVQLCHFLYGY